MIVHILKVKHIQDKDYEVCGIYTTEERMERGKRDYLKMKKKSGFNTDEFSFTDLSYEPDILI